MSATSRTPNLRAIRFFGEVVRLGSFSAAAKALGVTQPAVSRQVRNLEREIGVSLLYRDGRQVAPTEAGEVLRRRALDLDQAAQRAYDDVRAGATVPSGRLSIGASNIIGSILLPPVVARLRDLHPALTLDLSEGHSGVVEEWVTTGRIDVGLVWGKPKSPEINIEPLLALEMSVIAPARPVPGHEARGPIREIALADIVRLPMILPASPNSLRLLAESAAEKAGRPLNVAMEVNGLSLSLELVKAGLGYTLMSHATPPDGSSAKRVRVIRIVGPRVHWVLSLATRRGSRDTAARSEVLRQIARVCKEKITAGELRGRVLPLAAGRL
jgi:LysR family nitrogen assimilation transcriptional regulator